MAPSPPPARARHVARRSSCGCRPGRRPMAEHRQSARPRGSIPRVAGWPFGAGARRRSVRALRVAAAHLNSRLAAVWLAESSLAGDGDPAAGAHRRHPGGYRHAGRGRLHVHQEGSSAERHGVDDARGSPHRAGERGRPAACAPFRVSAAPSEADRSGFTHRRRRTTRTAQPAIDVRKSSLLRQFRANLRVRTGTNQPEQRPRRLSSGLQRGLFMAFARGLLTVDPGHSARRDGRRAGASPCRCAGSAGETGRGRRSERRGREEGRADTRRVAGGARRREACRAQDAVGVRTHEARSRQQPGADRVRDPHRAAEQICTRR